MPERLVRSAVFLERFLPRAAASLCHMPCFIFKRRGKIMRERFVGVETYSGFKADERPLRLHLNDRTLQVVTVEDRKSTRLNSSHVAISYADFCLKKKNQRDDALGRHGYRGHPSASGPPDRR